MYVVLVAITVRYGILVTRHSACPRKIGRLGRIIRRTSYTIAGQAVLDLPCRLQNSPPLIFPFTALDRLGRHDNLSW